MVTIEILIMFCMLIVNIITLVITAQNNKK